MAKDQNKTHKVPVFERGKLIDYIEVPAIQYRDALIVKTIIPESHNKGKTNATN